MINIDLSKLIRLDVLQQEINDISEALWSQMKNKHDNGIIGEPIKFNYYSETKVNAIEKLILDKVMDDVIKKLREQDVIK